MSIQSFFTFIFATLQSFQNACENGFQNINYEGDDRGDDRGNNEGDDEGEYNFIKNYIEVMDKII